jgi:outer membrane protein OmpA-like peptidoglycan-associated protein
MVRIAGCVAILAAAQVWAAAAPMAADCRMAESSAPSAEALNAAYRRAQQACRDAAQPEIRSKGLPSGVLAKGFVPIPVAVTMTFDRVQFAFDSARLLPEARPTLERIAEFLNLPENREKVVRIEGHTDATGGDDYNLLLSGRRANTVRDFLIAQRAIEPSRLEPKGWGRQRPLQDRAPDDPANRRVEFIVQ